MNRWTRKFGWGTGILFCLGILWVSALIGSAGAATAPQVRPDGSPFASFDSNALGIGTVNLTSTVGDLLLAIAYTGPSAGNGTISDTYDTFSLMAGSTCADPSHSFLNVYTATATHAGPISVIYTASTSGATALAVYDLPSASYTLTGAHMGPCFSVNPDTAAFHPIAVNGTATGDFLTVFMGSTGTDTYTSQQGYPFAGQGPAGARTAGSFYTNASSSSCHLSECWGNFSTAISGSYLSAEMVDVPSTAGFTAGESCAPSPTEVGATTTCSATTSHGTSPFTYSYTADSLTPSGSVSNTSWKWVFPTAETSVTACVNVTDATSAVAQACVSFQVFPTLSVTFAWAPTPALSNQTTYFTTTITGGEGPYSCAWGFGDGGTAAVCGPSHFYARAGNFTVNVTVTDHLSFTASHSAVVAATNSSGGGGNRTPCSDCGGGGVSSTVSVLATDIGWAILLLLIVVAVLYYRQRRT